MKLLKKISIFLILAITLFTMSACSSTNLATNGYLWFKEPSAFKPGWTEECEYELSFTNSTNKNSTEVKTEGYSLEIDAVSSYYKTKLESKRNSGRDYYVYTTELKLIGRYIEPNPKDGKYQTIDDTFVTVTEFNQDLTPVKSSKTYQSTFSNYRYEYFINYSGSTAEATLNESYLDGSQPRVQNFTFKKYNKNAYIDNELLLLIPRLFNLNDNFSRSFNTIDVLSNKNHEMNYYVYLNNGNIDVKNLPNYLLNGIPTTAVNEQGLISSAHLEIAITDTFSGSPIECYYAQDRDTHRHRLIETFTRFGSVGYIKYTLSNVTVTND